MKAGDLKRIIKGVDDNVEVVIFLPENVNPGVEVDYMRYVKEAEFSPACSISGAEFKITAGKGFGY